MSEKWREQAPYAAAIARYAQTHPVRYHTPGHGGDVTHSMYLTDFLGWKAVNRDIMPMVEGIDLGEKPTNLDLAQDLAAQAWGAKRTWFLTNGASQGNHLSVLAASLTGKKRLLLQRSVHSSVIDALMYTGMEASYLAPEVDRVQAMAHGVTAEAVAQRLAQAQADGEEFAAVYIVSPSYYGFQADIAAIAEVTHAAGVPLFVDEAWGPHFGFHPDLPVNASRLGADLVVSSTHKLAGALTQTAMLHLSDGPFADELEPILDRIVSVVKSTSENSLLLASLDLARAQLVAEPERIGASIAQSDSIRAQVRERGRFTVASDGFPQTPGFFGQDPFKVVIDVASGGLNGHEVRQRLNTEHGILVELSTHRVVVPLFGAGTAVDEAALLEALHALQPLPDSAQEQDLPELPAWGEPVMTVRDAYFKPAEIVAREQAVGRVSSDSLAAYPPGIPNVLPGERITAETVEYLASVAAAPTGKVRGAVVPDVSQLRVVVED